MNADTIKAYEDALIATLELVENQDGTPEFRSWAVAQAIRITRTLASLARKQVEVAK